MNHLPISITYLPDWYVQAVGRIKIESQNNCGIDELNPEDMNKLTIANESFYCYLYGNSGLEYSLRKEISNNVVSFPFHTNFTDTLFAKPGTDNYNLSSNMIDVLYGVNSEENKTEDKESRFQLLCKAFEDVKIFCGKDNKIFIYRDRGSNKFYNRKNLIREILSHVSDLKGYRNMIDSELFKKFLSSSIKDEDLRHAFLHKVG